MAHEDLWRNEHFREAFQRWWDEDWSWDGLAKRPAKRWLEGVFEENSASVRDAWQAEEAGLIEFGGRMWTRFHLPPFDRSGNLVADWYRLKGQEFSADVGRRLISAEGSYAARWKSDGAEPDTYHADLQGVIFPDGFSIPNKQAFADFSSSVFLGRFAYSENLRARFCNAIFAREARFDNSKFTGDALFNGSTFVAACSFEKVQFVRGAEFLDAWFAKTAMFQRALFNDDALFGSAIFEGQVSFAGAEFWGVAQLRGSAPFKARVNFSGANFWKECDFSNRSFDDSAAFTGVRFNGVPRFDQAKLHSGTDFGGSQFRGGEAMPDEWATVRVRLKSWRRLFFALRWIPPLLSLRWPGMRIVRIARDSATARYENAYRNLRRLALNIGDTQAEGAFHALELRCHRARTNARVLDRLGSFCYGLFSDYGLSMARPIGWLILCWALVVAAYLTVFSRPGGGSIRDCGVPRDWNRAGELVVSAGRQFLPSLFNSGSGLIESPQWLRCIAKQHELAFFFVSVGQTLFLVACISLFLIALRRRFQLRD